MPRTEIPVTRITKTGAAPPAQTTGDPTNNHEIANNGTTWIEAENTGATSARTVTVKISRTIDSQAVASRTYAVPVATTWNIRLGDPYDYGDTTEIDVDSAELKFRAYALG